VLALAEQTPSRRSVAIAPNVRPASAIALANASMIQ